MNEPLTVEHAMRRALSLAARGPATGVNPQVGCVLLNDAGEIVAEGWHRGAGTPHAEVDALSKISTGSITGEAGSITGVAGSIAGETGSISGVAAGLTAVVTLEPCNHTGRTGPCSVALIEAGVTRVIYSVSDPNPAAGGGAQRLRDAGVTVESGLLADETEELLHPWLTAVRHQRPFVTVKWASSLDGRAAAADGTSQWITGTAARQHVHERRAAADAIIVGTGTVFADDPTLTARGDAGELMEHQPIPVVIGSRAIPEDARLRSNPAGLIETRTRDVAAVLTDLYLNHDIRRVFVEGGPTVASAFIAAGLADEYLVYIAPTVLGGPGLALGDIGVATIADQRRLAVTSVEQLGDDILITARPKEGN